MVLESTPAPFAGLTLTVASSKSTKSSSSLKSSSSKSSSTSTSTRTTLHTTTSLRFSQTSSSSFVLTFPGQINTPLSTSKSTSSVNYFAPQTNGDDDNSQSSTTSSTWNFGAQTNGVYSQGTVVDSYTTMPSYTITAMNGGVCLMTYSDTSLMITPSYVTWVAETTPGVLKARLESGTVYAQPSITTSTSSSDTCDDETCVEIPLSEIPVCPDPSIPTLSTDPQVTRGASSDASGDYGAQPGLNTGQRAGLAVGIVVAVAILMVAGIWWVRKRGIERMATMAQRDIWGWGGGASPFGPTNVVGGRNADVQEAGNLVSGRNLREAIIGPAGARGFRSA